MEDLDNVKQRQWHVWYSIDTKSWYARATDYQGIINGKAIYKTIMLHRFIVNANSKLVVDHYDHNTLNNRKYNLRIAEKYNNEKNRKSKNKNNSSGYRNVFWSTRENRWLVTLQIKGKSKCFGRFKLEDVDKAGALAEEMRNKYYGEYAGED